LRITNSLNNNNNNNNKTRNEMQCSAVRCSAKLTEIAGSRAGKLYNIIIQQSYQTTVSRAKHARTQSLSQ